MVLSYLLVEVLASEVLVLLQDLPDVLNDELTRPDGLGGKQTVALGSRTLLRGGAWRRHPLRR